MVEIAVMNVETTFVSLMHGDQHGNNTRRGRLDGYSTILVTSAERFSKVIPTEKGPSSFDN